jgi:signal transduction histidine kinase
MRIMRERAAAIGARLDFVSESGNGLMVRIELPPPV